MLLVSLLIKTVICVNIPRLHTGLQYWKDNSSGTPVLPYFSVLAQIWQFNFVVCLFSILSLIFNYFSKRNRPWTQFFFKQLTFILCLQKETHFIMLMKAGQGQYDITCYINWSCLLFAILQNMLMKHRSLIFLATG